MVAELKNQHTVIGSIGYFIDIRAMQLQAAMLIFCF